MHQILLIQGPNMSYLGKRQPEIYGKTTAAQLDAIVRAHAKRNRYGLDIFYTHSEPAAMERLYASIGRIDGLLMNPAGWLFGAYPLRDTLRAVPFPYIEVHMTNIDKRGFHSILAETAVGVVAGFGVNSYILGLEAMLAHLKSAPKKKRG
ncbi:MAG: 3-dehydroquinate dehydratase [Betaproteobacteria bacterium]|nr:3-dehydroquinate dehydratase [Betaproteobacteria bacterium]